jgi:hypothetical protein
MNATFDDAVRDARRDPAKVRRVFTVSGYFSSAERGFVQRLPALRIAQLSELVLDKGSGAFLLGPGDDAAGDVERFAAEVAPACGRRWRRLAQWRPWR